MVGVDCRIVMDRKSDNPLFSSSPSGARIAGAAGGREPLASRMRPRNLDEFIGQDHIVGPGRLLRRAIQKDQLSSLLLSGPPGTGKTTLARIIANTTRSGFIALNAVLSGVAELREAIEKAKRHFELYSLKTILFVDEVHRWNKSQQDALLPWVENGTVILIGATTENPFFEVNRALVSRSRVFLLTTLGDEDLARVAALTLSDRDRGYGLYDVAFEEGALEHLVHTAEGDARSLLNALELAVETSVDRWPPEPGARIRVSMAVAEESIQKRVVLYDKDGDYHYDAISAFIKSLRGSDPDAALYWLSRMVYAGEDPSFIFRRMLISAAEDVGMADPEAIRVVESCAAAFDRIGMPEGQYHMSLAALYLATSPKSNSTMGYFDALKAVQEEGAEVPNHLKDASRDSVGFGHGEGYRYPHAYKDHWVAQQYLPDSMRRSIFYSPASTGFEGQRRQEVLARRETQLALAESDLEKGDEAGGGLSVWSREGERRRKWMARAEGTASARLRAAREGFFEALRPGRGESILMFDPRKGFYALEALRRSPEGTIAVLVDDTDGEEQLSRLTSDLPELSRPEIALPVPGTEIGGWVERRFSHACFDRFMVFESGSFRNAAFDLAGHLSSAMDSLRKAEGVQPRMVILELLKQRSSMLSSLLAENDSFRERISLFECGFGGGPGMAGPGLRSLEKKITEANTSGSVSGSFIDPECTAAEEMLARAGHVMPLRWEIVKRSYPRSLSFQEIDGWLDARHAYGAALLEALGHEDAEELRRRLKALGQKIEWPLFLALGET
jgi:putative ATPase